MSEVIKTPSNYREQAAGSQAVSVNIRHWLLYSQIQIQEGKHQGGIAGWLNEHNQSQFAYSEIAGYYLSSLSFMAKYGSSSPVIINRLQNTIEWLCANYKSSLPPATRYYLESNDHNNADWRNRALFSFDLAIIARGLANAQSLVDASVCAEVSARIYDLLSCLIDHDGSFRSHINRTNAFDVPVTWSTQPGPYQVKTAMAVLLTKPPANLRIAAELTLRKEISRAKERNLTGDLHPWFYYLEGLVLLALYGLDYDFWNSAVKTYSAIMEHQAVDGSLPASLPDHGIPSRSDVIAQALRIGCILKYSGYLVGKQWDARLEKLAHHLLCYCRHDGAVCFNLPQANSLVYWNAWCAMFAHQAFSFYGSLLRSHYINREALQSLF